MDTFGWQRVTFPTTNLVGVGTVFRMHSSSMPLGAVLLNPFRNSHRNEQVSESFCGGEKKLQTPILWSFLFTVLIKRFVKKRIWKADRKKTWCRPRRLMDAQDPYQMESSLWTQKPIRVTRGLMGVIKRCYRLSSAVMWKCEALWQYEGVGRLTSVGLFSKALKS